MQTWSSQMIQEANNALQGNNLEDARGICDMVLARDVSALDHAHCHLIKALATPFTNVTEGLAALDHVKDAIRELEVALARTEPRSPARVTIERLWRRAHITVRDCEHMLSRRESVDRWAAARFRLSEGYTMLRSARLESIH